MKCVCGAILAMLLCASCASIQSHAEADGIARRNAALSVLAQQKDIQTKSYPDLDSKGRDVMKITKAVWHEFASWGQGETGWQPSPADREALVRLVRSRTDDPVLLVKRYPGGRARVNTGTTRFGLDGGGTSFYLIKTHSTWRIIHAQDWVS